MNLTAEQDLYEALKSMAESYDLVIQTWPAGPAKDSFIGFFIGTRDQAEKAITRFEMVKARNTSLGNDAYMANLIKFDPTANFGG